MGSTALWRSMRTSPWLLPEEEGALCGSLFTRVFFSQPDGVSFCGRPCHRTPVNELPDPHFKVKQFAFRVASSSAHLPLEEPLLGRALDMNGNPYRSVRPAPVEEPHTVLPCLSGSNSRRRYAPGRSETVRLLLRRVAGVHWLANRHCSLPRPSAIPYNLLRPAVHTEQELLRLPTD